MESKAEKVFTCVRVKGIDDGSLLPISKYLWLEILAYAYQQRYSRVLLINLSKSIRNFSLSEEGQILLEKIFIDLRDSYKIHFDLTLPELPLKYALDAIEKALSDQSNGPEAITVNMPLKLDSKSYIKRFMLEIHCNSLNYRAF